MVKVNATRYLGRFNVGKLRAGKFNGGNEVDTDVPVGSVSPLVCNVGKLLKVLFKNRHLFNFTFIYLFVLSDGRLNDGKDNVGSVGTDSGGRPKLTRY